MLPFLVMNIFDNLVNECFADAECAIAELPRKQPAMRPFVVNPSRRMGFAFLPNSFYHHHYRRRNNNS